MTITEFLRVALRAAVAVAASLILFVSPATAEQASVEPGIDRPGADYKSVPMRVASPESCRFACEQDEQCKAYTFVVPGVQGPAARCYLKNAVPNAVASNCCTSGVKLALRAPMPRSPQTATSPRLQERTPVLGARQPGTVTAPPPGSVVVPAVPAVNPGPLGRGQAEGSINGKTKLPSCPPGDRPAAVDKLLAMLDQVAGTFGASASKSYYCGRYKREIATGVTLAPPMTAAGKAPGWGQLGGRGDLMADAMLCLLKDIGNLPGGKLRLAAPVPVAIGKVELKQTVGLSDFNPEMRTAKLYQVTRVCAPLLGCLDAQRQTFTATVRASAPAWPGGLRFGDYPIANAYAVELASDWGATTLNAKLPTITFLTPYGKVSAKPGFDYATNLLPIDSPYSFKGSSKHPFHYPSSWGAASPILQDTYGRSGTPFILHVIANLPQAMTSPPQDAAPGTIFIPQPVGALKPQGWVSQIGLGGRDGTGTKAWKPGAGVTLPERFDYDMTTSRSVFEAAPAANFVAKMPIRFEPPNPSSLLPGSLQGIGSVELWIEVTPTFAADYAAQLSLLAREGVMVHACRPSSGEFAETCGLTETALVAQANAAGHVKIDGRVYLKISIPFVDDIVIDEPFDIAGWDLSRTWDPAPAVGNVQRAHDVAAWAGSAAYASPGDVRWQGVRGFSGLKSGDIRQWTEDCLKTQPKTVSTMPEEPHEPGKADDLKPDLLPCNICVTDKGKGKFAPFKLFGVQKAKAGLKSEACWVGREGCYDLCSWNKATSQWTQIEKSAGEVVGYRCVQPQVK
jgi:PAN domain